MHYFAYYFALFCLKACYVILVKVNKRSFKKRSFGERSFRKRSKYTKPIKIIAAIGYKLSLCIVWSKILNTYSKNADFDSFVLTCFQISKSKNELFKLFLWNIWSNNYEPHANGHVWACIFKPHCIQVARIAENWRYRKKRAFPSFEIPIFV